MRERNIRQLVEWAQLKSKTDNNYEPLINPELWDDVHDSVIYMLIELMADCRIEAIMSNNRNERL